MYDYDYEKTVSRKSLFQNTEADHPTASPPMAWMPPPFTGVIAATEESAPKTILNDEWERRRQSKLREQTELSSKPPSSRPIFVNPDALPRYQRHHTMASGAPLQETVEAMPRATEPPPRPTKPPLKETVEAMPRVTELPLKETVEAMPRAVEPPPLAASLPRSEPTQDVQAPAPPAPSPSLGDAQSLIERYESLKKRQSSVVFAILLAESVFFLVLSLVWLLT